MAVTSPSIFRGRPSSSSAVDQLAYGDETGRRPFFLSAGNIRSDIYPINYLNENDVQQVESPAQAWNAVTVGACTEKTAITDPGYEHWTPITEGDISPTSRTSVLFGRQWPIKPDIVLEGGNMASDGGGPGRWLNDLVMLTIDHRINTRLFTTIQETSAATALAARLGAQVMADRPAIWPETVRALIIHSANEPAMNAYRTQRSSQEHKAAFLRRYGYGVPDLERCLLSSRNDVSLVIEDQLQAIHQGKLQD